LLSKGANKNFILSGGGVMNTIFMQPDEQNEEIRSILLKRLNSGENLDRATAIEVNIPLVRSIVRDYLNRGADYEDLFQEGVIGLVRALDKFKPSLGYQFSTYATPWIHQAIQEYLRKSADTIRKPANYYSYLKKMRMGIDNFTSETGATPSLEELSRVTGIDETIVKGLYSLRGGTISLDTPFFDDPANTLFSTLPGDYDVESEALHECMMGEFRRTLNEAVSELPDKQKIIIKNRLGLTGEPPKTLRELGEELGISYERVRQLEKEAIGKLKRHKRLNALRKQLN